MNNFQQNEGIKIQYVLQYYTPLQRKGNAWLRPQNWVELTPWRKQYGWFPWIKSRAKLHFVAPMGSLAPPFGVKESVP